MWYRLSLCQELSILQNLPKFFNFRALSRPEGTLASVCIFFLPSLLFLLLFYLGFIALVAPELYGLIHLGTLNFFFFTIGSPNVKIHCNVAPIENGRPKMDGNEHVLLDPINKDKSCHFLKYAKIINPLTLSHQNQKKKNAYTS